jgi:hypothetical protein
MMKRKNIIHALMAVILCVMLILTNAVLPENVATALAAGKTLSSLSISGIATKEYTGKAVTQSPVIKDGTKTLKKGTDYTVSYKNNQEIGTATVILKGKGNYSGSVSKSFTIIPPKVEGLTAKSVVAGIAELAWNLDYGQVLSGFQVYYATSQDGKYSKLATVKTNTYKAELTGGKSYYLKVRAYTRVGGEIYYGKYTKAVKVSVLKEQSKINIIDSGKAYGNYIKISDIPEEITKQMKYLYPTGAFTELSIQYVDKTSKSERWVDFFAEVTEKNNPVMGDNEEVGYYRFRMISSDDSTKINDHYKAMNPDGERDFDHEKVMQYGVFLIDVKENPAVNSERVEQNYLDAKEDGYLTIIVAGAF